jgi:hypothetical protein
VDNVGAVDGFERAESLIDEVLRRAYMNDRKLKNENGEHT